MHNELTEKYLVVDTNILVAGLLTKDIISPTYKILLGINPKPLNEIIKDFPQSQYILGSREYFDNIYICRKNYM